MARSLDSAAFTFFFLTSAQAFLTRFLSMPLGPALLSRLSLVLLLSVLPLKAWSAKATPRSKPFSTETLRQEAKALAKKAYAKPPLGPEELATLNYDALRALRFQTNHALWKAENRPFQLQFFHLGGFYREPVELFTVSKGKAAPIPFDTTHFDGSATGLPLEILRKAGFSGFRAHAAINNPEYLDEVLVFLGASYFRSLGKNQLYGLSARGLAIDTGTAKGEEFPSFRRFWIEEPAPGATQLVIHALLDSPSVTGAYRFTVKPGEATVMEVSATLYTRTAVEQLGLAPLTSMFLHGENDPSPTEDFRPEVHDSDGLLIWNGNGERLWRPLNNPSRLGVSFFQTRGLRGFGVLQRDTAFANYEDLEARYEKRPSLWVEPVQGFEEGSVVLLEIPSTEEIHDNIAAFYKPAAPTPAGAEIKLAYRLLWGNPKIPEPTGVSEVTATRRALRKWVVDFGPQRPKAKTPTPAPQVAPSATFPLEAMVTTSRGRISKPLVQRNEVNGGYRVTFELDATGTDTIELRCFVKQGDETLTETWSATWMP